jgi:KDO2-lipid IV(A) lauroyltransferase
MEKFLKQLKYLAEYIAFITATRIIRLFGVDKAADICAFLARKTGPLSSVHKVAEKNLEVLGVTQEADKKLILENLWDNFGRFIGEMPYVNTMSPEEILVPGDAFFLGSMKTESREATSSPCSG